MTEFSPYSLALSRPANRAPRFILPLAIPATALGVSAWIALSFHGAMSPDTTLRLPATPVPAATVAKAEPAGPSGLFAPLDHAPAPFAQSRPLSAWEAAPRSVAALEPQPAVQEPVAQAPESPPEAVASAPDAVKTAPSPADTVRLVQPPVPPARPPELRSARGPAAERTPEAAQAAAETPRNPSLQNRRSRMAAVPAPVQEDNRSFIDKLFGIDRSPGQAMAYAAPQDDPAEAARGRLLGNPLAARPVAPGSGTAVYDIAAKTLTLPSGEKLEAHSGLGDRLDDPRFVHERMKGPTPPHTYELTLREALFHGVRAIRLNPVGGSQAIHGRAGLLAHTFMLGPRGDSNGCISIRDYDRFLQAYLRGEMKRLVVVASAR
jgi:hypothetical protein